MSELQAISGALAAAQGAFTHIVRDKTVRVSMKAGGSYSFSYAPLESILRAVVPALSANGLCMTQNVVRDEGKEFVETILRHSSGESIVNRTALFVRDDGPQAYGSALTYARRYSVTLLLCVCADDDDDGNAAEGNSAEVTRQREPEADIPPETRKAAKQYADKFVEAFNLGMEDAVYDLHLECNQDPALYSLVSTYIPTPTRREMRMVIERCREARRPNGRQ